MITSLMEMLELPNFGHMATSIICVNFAADVMDRNYNVITFISKYLYFNKAYSSHFC